MSEAGKEVEMVIRTLAEEAQRGPHPEPAVLAGFAAGRLGGEDADLLRAHLALCPDCMMLAEEAASFAPRPAESAAEQAEIDGAWQSLSPKLRSEGRVVPVAGRRAAPAPRWPLALAASLAAAVLGLSVWVGSLRRTVADLSRPQVNAPIFDLYPQSAARSEPEERGELALAPAVRWLSLVLNAPGSPDDATYRVEVRRADGGLAWQGEGLRKNAFGSFTLTLPRSLAGNGEVRVRLLATAAGEEKLVEEYPLRIVDDPRPGPAR